jgi:hypothetical protein
MLRAFTGFNGRGSTMAIPVQTSTEIPLLRALARIPLLGAFLMLLVTGWPLGVYINVMESMLHTQKLGAIHPLVGGTLAAAWSAVLWFPLKTKFSVLWIPAPIFYLLMGVIVAFGK